MLSHADLIKQFKKAETYTSHNIQVHLKLVLDKFYPRGVFLISKVQLLIICTQHMR